MNSERNVGASVSARAAAPRTTPHERGRSRPNPMLWLVLIVTLQFAAQAQEPAVVTFTLDFPGSEPSHYAVSVSSDGRSSYDSDGRLSPDSDGDPFRLDFSMSPQTSKRIFDLAARANYFQGEIDSRKKNLASTGVKTLTYKGSGRSTTATYNYSPVAAVQEITRLFQSLSSTLEFGRRLQYSHRYQKLALDEELKRMEDAANGNNLEEMSAIVPILRSIVADTTVINPVRARAQRLIERTGAIKR